MYLKTNSFNSLIFSCLLLILSISFVSNVKPLNLSADGSLYYEEKYFRLLSNNYNDIEQGVSWTIFGKENENGIGFKAAKDFGSIIILKDWSMYSFKLTKVVFRPFCSVNMTDFKDGCAEMWLYHTKDSSYFSPARKMFLKQNYLIVVVQFKVVPDNHPGKSQLFSLLRLKDFIGQIEKDNPKEISPSKPVKLYQIIQNQPSYLFESKLENTQQDCLFLVFSQYHFISNTDFTNLNSTIGNYTQTNSTFFNNETKYEYYRNSKNPDELKPMGTLLAYSGAEYLKYFSLYCMILFLLF